MAHPYDEEDNDSLTIDRRPTPTGEVIQQAQLREAPTVAPAPALDVESFAQAAPQQAPQETLSQPAADPFEPRTVQTPTILHRRQTDARDEQRVQQQDQQRAYTQQRQEQQAEDRRQRELVRGLKDSGVEIDTDPTTGIQRPKTDEQGRTLYKPATIDPFHEDETGVYSIKRDRFGSEQKVPLKPQIDPATGEKFVTSEDGVTKKSLGVDEGFLAKRDASQAGEVASFAKSQVAELKSQQKALRDREKSLQEEIGLASTEKEPTTEQRITLKRAQEDLARVRQQIQPLQQQHDALQQQADVATKVHAEKQSVLVEKARSEFAKRNPGSALALQNGSIPVSTAPPAEAIGPDATPPPPGLNDILSSDSFKAAPVNDRVLQLRSWVNQQVDYRAKHDPEWNAQKEKAFRGQYPDRSGLFGALAELGTGIRSAAVDQFPEDLARMARGGDVKLKGDGWADRWIAEQEADKRARGTSIQQMAGSKMAEALQQGPASMVTSAATGITGAKLGAAAALPFAAGGAAVSGPAAPAVATGAEIIGGVVGAAALSGVSFYRLAKDQFVEQVRDKVLAGDPEMTEAKWATVRGAIESKANQYGLWEAGPEAVSQGLTAGLFNGATGKAARAVLAKAGISEELLGKLSKNVAVSLAAKYGTEVAEELATETTTQVGQGKIESEVGLRDKAPTWAESFKEIAGPTIVGSLLQGGASHLVEHVTEGITAKREAQQADQEFTKDWNEGNANLPGFAPIKPADAPLAKAATDAAVSNIRQQWNAHAEVMTRATTDLDEATQAGDSDAIQAAQQAYDSASQQNDAIGATLKERSTAAVAAVAEATKATGGDRLKAQAVIRAAAGADLTPQEAAALMSIKGADGKPIATRGETPKRFVLNEQAAEALRPTMPKVAELVGLATTADSPLSVQSGSAAAASTREPNTNPATSASPADSSSSSAPSGPTTEQAGQAARSSTKTQDLEASGQPLPTPNNQQEQTTNEPVRPLQSSPDEALRQAPAEGEAESRPSAASGDEASGGRRDAATVQAQVATGARSPSASSPTQTGGKAVGTPQTGQSNDRGTDQGAAPAPAATRRETGAAVDEAAGRTEQTTPQAQSERAQPTTEGRDLAESQTRPPQSPGSNDAPLQPAEEGRPVAQGEDSAVSRDPRQQPAAATETSSVPPKPRSQPEGTGQGQGTEQGVVGGEASGGDTQAGKLNQAQPSDPERASKFVRLALDRDKIRRTLDALGATVSTKSALRKSFVATYTSGGKGGISYRIGINLERLAGRIANLSDEAASDYITSAVSEEVTHLAQFEAVRRPWQEGGMRRSFGEAFAAEYQTVRDKMTDAEVAAAREAYGDPRLDGAVLGAEFVRQLVQTQREGRPTEATHAARPIIERILAVLRDLLSNPAARSEALQRAYDATSRTLDALERGEQQAEAPKPTASVKPRATSKQKDAPKINDKADRALDQAFKGLFASEARDPLTYDQLAEQEYYNRKPPTPIEPTEQEAANIMRAYRYEVEDTGFPSASIANVMEGAGFSRRNIDRAKGIVYHFWQQGQITLSTGDWSMSDNRERAWGVTKDESPKVTINHNARGLMMRVLSPDGLAASEPTQQQGLPPAKIGDFVTAAQVLIESGITTPEGMAQVLEQKFQGKARPFAQALWDAFGMVNPSLRGTHDWNEVHAKLEQADVKSRATSEAEPAQKAGPRKFNLAINDGGFSDNPIASTIMEAGGLLSKTNAKQKKGANFVNIQGEYDDAPKLASPAHNRVYRPNGMTPDDATQVLVDAGLLPEGATPPDMWRELERASQSAQTVRTQQAATVRQQKEMEAMGKAFDKDSAIKNRGEKEITFFDVNPGDTVKVGTESMKVVSVDAADGSFVLEDGHKYGTQQVEGTIYGKLERSKVEKAEAPKPVTVPSREESETSKWVRQGRDAQESQTQEERSRPQEQQRPGTWMYDRAKEIAIRDGLSPQEALNDNREMLKRGAIALAKSAISGSRPFHADFAGEPFNLAIPAGYEKKGDIYTPKPTPPQLRKGENQGDLLQGKDAPFNLAGETATDGDRVAREKQQAERDAAEAKANAERDQTTFGDLAAAEPMKSQADLQAELDGIRKGWEAEDIDSWASLKNGDITLSQIEIPKGERGKGKGTAAMRKLLSFAQDNGLRVLLTPDTSYGATSVDRLKRFYKSLGFVENKGRNKDYRTRESMIWRPASDGLAASEPAGPTDSPAFKRWFGKSKVVDADGNPLVVYHGSPNAFTEFDPLASGTNLDSGFLGTGFYHTDSPDTASYYATTGTQKASNVKPLYLSLQNPFMWGNKGGGTRMLVYRNERLPEAIHDAVVKRAKWQFDPSAVDGDPNELAYAERDLSWAIRQELESRGHDGVIANTRGGTHEYVAFRPEQIKSSIANRGTFDPSNPSILAASEPGTTPETTFTKARVEDMLQRAWNANLKDYYDPADPADPKSWREWVAKDSAYNVALVLDSDSEIYHRFLANIGEEFTAEDVVKAYQENRLPQSLEAAASSKTAEIPLEDTPFERRGGIGEPRARTPLSPEKLKTLWTTATTRATKKNGAAVQAARHAVFIAIHSQNASADIGVEPKAINAALRSWSNYPASAKALSEQLNRGRPEVAQWTGIENSAWISKAAVTPTDVDAFVKSVEAPDKSWQTPDAESLRRYIIRTFLAVDTRISYADLSFKVDAALSSRGLYESSKKLITMRANSANTVAHEIGHYLDHKWALEAGINTLLSDATVNLPLLAERTSPQRAQWVKRYMEFVNDISERADIRSGYTMSRREVFARFVDQFAQWANKEAGAREYAEQGHYSDRFHSGDYSRFVRLLQEKSFVDAKDGNPLAKEAVTQPSSDVQQDARPARESNIPEGTPTFHAGNATVTGPTVFTLAASEPIRAYHGTPHKVDRFSLEKIGTGEGAQVFGFGLYFAESEAVAESYRDNLSEHRATLDGNEVSPETLQVVFGPSHPGYLDGVIKASGVIDRWLRATDSGNPYPAGSQRASLWDALSSRGKSEGKGGNKYTVSLDVDQDELLDWDKPLSEQSEKVKAALEDAKISAGYLRGDAIYRLAAQQPKDAAIKLRSLGIFGIRYLDQQSRNRPLNEVRREFIAELPDDASTEEVADLLGTGTFSPKNEAFLKALAADDWLGFDYPAQAISAALGRNIGDFDPSPELLKTIADAQAGGTRNFVIFDESKIKITHENGREVSMQEAMQLGASEPEEAGQSNLNATVEKNIRDARMMSKDDAGAISFLRKMAERAGQQGKQEAADNFTAAADQLEGGGLAASEPPKEVRVKWNNDEGERRAGVIVDENKVNWTVRTDDGKILKVRKDRVVIDRPRKGLASSEPFQAGPAQPKPDLSGPLQDALKALHPQERKVLTMKLKGEPVATIMRVTGLNEKGVANAYAVATAKLRIARDKAAGISPTVAKALNPEAIQTAARAKAYAGSSDPLPEGEKYAGNLNLNRISTTDEATRTIWSAVDQQAEEVKKQKRGSISHQETERTANELGITLKQLQEVRPGSTANAEHLVAIRQIELSKSEAFGEAQKKWKLTGAAEDFATMVQAMKEFELVHATMSGLRAEAGRALSSFNIIAKARREQDPALDLIDKLKKVLGGEEVGDERLRQLAAMPDDPLARAKWLRAQMEFSTAEILRSYWMANVLSGVPTHGRNTLSNGIFAASIFPLRYGEAAIDAVLAPLTKRERRHFIAEANAANAAYLGGLPEGLRNAWYIMKNGLSSEEAAKLEIPRHYEFQGIMRPWNYPGRLLLAADSIFKTMALKSEVAAGAARTALKEGLRGPAYRERFEQLVANPTAEMMEKAQEFADYMTFQGKPDEILKVAYKLRNSIQIPKGVPLIGGMQPLHYMIPFVQVPYNVAKTSLQFSPLGALGLLSPETRQKLGAETIMAKALLGSAVLAGAAGLAASGALTGAAPPDEAEKDAFYRSGKKPYSLKIGDRWVSYRFWGPLAFPFVSAAAFHDATTKRGDAPTAERIMEAAAAIGQSIVDQTYFQGLSAALDAVRKPEQFAKSVLASTLSGFIPFSSLQRNFEYAFDDTLRKPEHWYEAIYAGVPIMGATVPPRLTTLGEPAKRLGQEGLLAFGPAPMSQDNLDPTERELERLEVFPGFVGSVMRIGKAKVKLTGEEQRTYQVLTGRGIYGAAKATMDDPEYRSANDEQKIKMLKKAIDKVRDKKTEQMRGKLLDRLAAGVA